VQLSRTGFLKPNLPGWLPGPGTNNSKPGTSTAELSYSIRWVHGKQNDHPACGFWTIVATHSGMIVATYSGVIVAMYSGGSLPPIPSAI